jgi:hypothetical protein
MTPLILAVSVVLAAAAPEGATNPAAAPAAQSAAAPKQKAEDPNEVVCRYEEQEGSRIRNRRCMPRAQWDIESADLQRFFRQASEASAHAPPAGAPPTMTPH